MSYDSRYYYGLGVDEYNNCNFENALNNFRKSLEIGEHFKTYERLYQVLLELGRNVEALEAIKRAYEINSKNNKVAIEYAKALLASNDKILAKKILSQIIDRNPSYGPALKLRIIMNVN